MVLIIKYNFLLLYSIKTKENLHGTEVVRTFAKRNDMETKMISNNARLETRLTTSQKAIFERAAVLGGYRSVSDFVVTTVQEKARRIIKEHEQIFASKKDSEYFFDAIVNADKPNDKLVQAAQRYNELFTK